MQNQCFPNKGVRKVYCWQSLALKFEVGNVQFQWTGFMRFRFKTLATIGICLPLLGGCGRVEYNSISISELEAREPFVATVEVVRIDDYRDKGGTFGLVVSIGLKTETGERILMGGMQEKDNMAEFARSLEERKVYEFPKVWLDYKARMKSVTN